jgi:hypothetical protein
MRNVYAPAVHLVLRAHPPAPARVGLVPRSRARRILLATFGLVGCWALVPLSAALPPYYPWPVVLVSLGVWLAWHWGSTAWRVLWFAGNCPRCGASLRLLPGELVSLPHTLDCLACHFEPRLEVYEPAVEEVHASDGRGIRHLLGECAGSWREETLWGQRYLTCTSCGTRHHATPALLAAARGENERGHLLDELAAEGRFLT